MKRKVMTVRKLAQWISAEILPDGEGSVSLWMHREWVFDPSRGLHQRTKEELVTLHDRLCRAIPDDFEFSLEFEKGEVFSTLEFLDGPQAGFGMGFPVPLDRHLIHALRELDWNSLRSRMIPGTQCHENLADQAEAYPVMLEATAEIQSRHNFGITRFRKEMTVRNPPFAVLSVDEEADQIEYEVTGFEDRLQFIGGMGDLLACEQLIVDIWTEGSALAPAAVDLLRQEALERLGPISRAKAEGRFRAAFDAMGQIQF